MLCKLHLQLFRMRHQLQHIKHVLFMGMTIWTMMSCDNSLERLTTNEYPKSGNQAQTGHVLCVVIDGASGKAVNEAYTTQKAHPRSLVNTGNALWRLSAKPSKVITALSLIERI